MARRTPPVYPRSALARAELVESLPSKAEVRPAWIDAIRPLVLTDSVRREECVRDLGYALELLVFHTTYPVPSATSRARALRMVAKHTNTLIRRRQAARQRLAEIIAATEALVRLFVDASEKGEGQFDSTLTDDLEAQTLREETRYPERSRIHVDVLLDRLAEGMSVTDAQLQDLLRLSENAALQIDEPTRRERHRGRRFWFRYLAGATQEYGEELSCSIRKCVVELLKIGKCLPGKSRDAKTLRLAFGKTHEGLWWFDLLSDEKMGHTSRS